MKARSRATRRGFGCGRAASPVAAAPLLAAALLLLLATGLAGALLTLAGCGNADPFVGLYYEPATARRFEITKDGDAYKLTYGVDRRQFRAVREGDQLVVTDPLGGKTIVRPGDAEGSLVLVVGGKTTVLRPLPGHQ